MIDGARRQATSVPCASVSIRAADLAEHTLLPQHGEDCTLLLLLLRAEMTPLKQLLARIRLSDRAPRHRQAERNSVTEASAFSRLKAARSVPSVVAVGIGMQFSAPGTARNRGVSGLEDRFEGQKMVRAPARAPSS